jgi:hypothetical protein
MGGAPFTKYELHGGADGVSTRNVSIVRRLSTRELPGTFDGVESMAVGRHKQPSKPLPVRGAQFFVQAGMMIPNIIHNQHHPAPGMARDPAKLFK